MRANSALKNASWIIICRIIQSILAFVIGIVTARYLGPSNYGLISYAASTVAFVAPVMYLGLNSTLVQELIESPANEGEILGSAIGASLLSSFLCIIGVNTFVAIVNRGEKETGIVCALYSSILLFQAIDLIQYWFQAKLLSKYTSLAMLGAYVLISIYKVLLLISRCSVYWFAISSSAEYMIIAIALIVIYKKLKGSHFSFSSGRAIRMIRKSKFFIISNLMITVFTQTDRVMLKIMLGDAATGVYSVAVGLAVMTSFVFAAIIDSSRPLVLESKKINETKFVNNMKRTYSIVIYISLIQGILITLLAKPIVIISYGEQYADAIEILRMVVWFTIFSYIGAVRSVWILACNLQRLLWIINMSGAIANVILNWILIPSMGVSGAALASIITQLFNNVIVGFIIPVIRPNNRIMFESLNPNILIGMISEFRRASR